MDVSTGARCKHSQTDKCNPIVICISLLPLAVNSFDTLRSLEKLTGSDEMTFSSSPPDHHSDNQAGADTTDSVIASQADFSFANSSGTEFCFSDRPAGAAVEAGKRLAQPPVASDAKSTTRFGSQKALEIGSNSQSDIGIEGDGVTGKDDAGNAAAGGVADTAHMSSWAGLEDQGLFDGDIDEGFPAPDWLDVTHSMLDQTSSGPGAE